MSTINVLIAEDHAIVREGFCSLLKLEHDIKVVGLAENGRLAVQLADQLKPDVIIMDIAMPLLNGIEATRQILHNDPTAKVLILSAHSDDAYVQQVMTLGAFGYLIKQSTAHALADAIRRVHAGKKYFSPTVSKRLIHHRERAKALGELAPKDGADKLTSRETEILQLIAEGKANKESAEELHISVKTVEKHRQSLMDKLNIHDTAGLTRHAIAIGIIESSVQVTIVE